MVIKLQSYVRWKSETAPEGERVVEGGQRQQVLRTVNYVHTLILFDSCRSQLFGAAKRNHLSNWLVRDNVSKRSSAGIFTSGA